VTIIKENENKNLHIF